MLNCWLTFRYSDQVQLLAQATVIGIRLVESDESATGIEPLQPPYFQILIPLSDFIPAFQFE